MADGQLDIPEAEGAASALSTGRRPSHAFDGAPAPSKAWHPGAGSEDPPLPDGRGSETRAGAGVVDVSVIVVSFRTRELTVGCLRSLREQTRGVGMEVIVVDNDSGDGSAEAIAEEFPEVRLLAERTNHGFARANNLAAETARGRYILLLNPDTVVRDGAVQKMVAFAERHREYGIFGGRTVYGDGSLNPTSCWGRPTVWGLVCRGLGLSAAFRGSRVFDPEGLGGWKRDTVREVGIVTGCFLLIRAELWRRLGGFDPDFFMYGEDADLCLRARRMGERCLICPEAEIVHYRGASEPVRGDKIVRLFGAKVRLMRKHWGKGRAAFGVGMLKFWAWSRWVAFGVVGKKEGSACWGEVWRRRGEWGRNDE